MPIELLTQQAVRHAQRLRFCYYCGVDFAATDQVNDDHVPPSSVFLPDDRNFPLLLPTHYDCNHGEHLVDQAVGQLVGILHARAPRKEHNRLAVYAGHDTDRQPVAAVGGFDLPRIVRRWISGFHAALYLEPLRCDGQFMTILPLATGDLDTGRIDEVPAIAYELVRAIRTNRSKGLDRIVTRSGKCTYECVWLESDDGRWFCAFALDVYRWAELGDTARFGRRGCFGMYVPTDGQVSLGATRGLRPGDEQVETPLDPFVDS